MATTINITWANTDKTILIITYPASWQAAELSLVLDRAIAMLDSADGIVHIISDFSATNLVSAGLINQFQRIYAYTTHKNMGMNIIVGTNSFMQMIGDHFIAVYPKVTETIRFARSLADAYQMIESKNGK